MRSTKKDSIANLALRAVSGLGPLDQGDVVPSNPSPRQWALRFLMLARQAHTSSKDPALDLMEQRILESLGAAWAEGGKVTVLKAMAMGDDASPTTVHRRLKSLRRKGYLSLKEDESDNRVKFVMPTPVTDRYFDRLGRCIQEAMQGS